MTPIVRGGRRSGSVRLDAAVRYVRCARGGLPTEGGGRVERTSEALWRVATVRYWGAVFGDQKFCAAWRRGNKNRPAGPGPPQIPELGRGPSPACNAAQLCSDLRDRFAHRKVDRVLRRSGRA
jgi:hypothetical protein